MSSQIISIILLCVLIVVFFGPKMEKLEDVKSIILPDKTALQSKIVILQNHLQSLQNDIRLLKLDLKHAEDAVESAGVYHLAEKKEIVKDIKSSISNKIDEMTLLHAQILDVKSTFV